MLSLTATIDIKELPATELVSRDIYDEGGNITGQISEEEYQRQMKEMEGRAFFAIQTSIGDQHTLIRSNPTSGDPVIERNERANTLAQGLAQIGVSIYKNFAP